VGSTKRTLRRSAFIVVLGCSLYGLGFGRALTAGPNAPAIAILETATVMLPPQDTFLTLDHNNYSANALLRAHTWPDYQVADAIVMTFDFSALPTGAVIQKAELNLALVQSDGAAGSTYTMTAHKLLGKSAVIGAATGYTADGTTTWTANGCCSGGLPMAQADISTAYDSVSIDHAPGFKAWDMTTLVQEWMLAPATNFGLLLNADTTSPRDRYRYFASMEHANSSLRPFLRVTYAAADVAPPSVAIAAPGSGMVLTGTAGVEATATDNVAVAAVQFQIDGAPVGPELTNAPYRLNWDTTTVSDGTHTLTAIARDSTGNSAPSAGVSVAIANGILILTPEDTTLKLDAVNYSTSTHLATHTWPDNRAASAILMTFDFAALPAGAVVQDATLHLNLVQSDVSVDNGYVVAAHKMVGTHAVLAAATGYTADGTTRWTPNACCQNGVPLAQADISAAYDSPVIDKAAGFKTWDVTALVQEWLLDPATNAGLLLNADASKPGDRYRIFASTEHADATVRPFLRITYSPAADLVISALEESVTSDRVTSEALDPLIEAALAPVATAPISPSGSIATATPAFSWSAVTNATYYLLSITDADPGSPLETWYTPSQAGCPTGIGTCTVPAPRGLKPGLVTWKVLTYNLDGYGPWSSTMTAVVEAVDGALPQPTAIGPSGPISTQTPTYSWNPMGGIVWYQLSVTDALGTSRDFWYTPAQACPSSPCGVTPNVLLAIGPAQWRTRAWSAVGASAWTAPLSFDVANAAPGKATLIAPAGAIASQTPTFTWHAVLGVNYYLLKVSDADNVSVERWYRPSDVGCPLGTGICSASPSISVLPGPAEWQVITWNAIGYGPWSDPQPFVVDIADLTILGGSATPTPISPTGSITTIHPAYRWSAHASAKRYRLSLRINGGTATQLWFTRTAAACNAVDCQVQPNITLQSGTAEWQVQMWTNNGHGNWSAVVPLTVNIAVPPAPELVSPSGVTSPSPSFVWESSANADYYYVRVSDATGLRIDQWLKPEEVGCFSEAANCTLTAGVTLNNGAGSWEALAWNATGYSPWSPALGFVVSSDGTPPAVAISAPTAGATVSGTVTVSANASDNISVGGVQFKLDGVNLGAEDTTSPYSVSWNTTTAANGTHTLTAVARDTTGNTTTSTAVTVTVSNDTTAPTVSISAPAGGATVSGTLSVTASGSDNVGVSGVQFKLDGVNLGTEDTTSPYSRSWNTTTASNGSHTLTAVARDAAGNTTTSIAVTVTVANDTTAPTVSISAPAGGATVSGTVTVSGSASDNVGVVGVQFKLDGANLGSEDTTSPYSVSWNTTTATNGSHTLTAVARDAAGNTTTSTGVTMTVANDTTAPTVSISAPAGGATVSGTVTVSGSASDNVGVVGVQFKLDGANLGSEDTTSPYSVSWNTTTAANGSHALTAVARDAAGNTTTSIAVTVTVANDTTAPTVSISAPAGGATVSSTVTVSGNASDNVGVVGVQFKLDGANLGAEDTTSPYSVSWNTTTTANGSHTLTAVARDAAGNTTTSTGVAVTVANDTTAPTVSISAPAGGATVSGTVTVSGSASDNIGVVGVQFKLDGTNLGTEDTTSPYSVSWNTTTAANGSHSLTAVARDAAGNTTTSAAVAVTVSNAAPSEIAALYPGDVGIESHPDVILVERFEDTIGSVLGRWTDVLNGPAMSLASDVPPGSTGSKSLNIPWVGGGVNDGGHLYKQLATGIDDVLYVRYYIKYPSSGQYQHSGIWMGGFNPSLPWPNPQAGTKPVGNDRFMAAAEQNSNTLVFDHYDYWMNMHQSTDGNYWGNLLLNDPAVQGSSQWMCVEHMVKLNNPVSASNGEHAIWLNGVKVSHLGQGFPNGTWSGGIFTQSPSGTPFPGFRWRSDANLKLNWLWLQNYASIDPAGFTGTMRFDHVVAAKSRVGCLTSGSSDTTLPTVSVTAPAGGATVSGTITASANASDNVGVVGVQFKLDGNNLGAEDTTAPYATSWNTTTATNGSHTITAVARDAAGNTRTSAGVTVTVSNASGGAWPNEPGGMTLFSDQPWNLLTGLGWNYLRRTSSKDASIVTDAAAPLSPSNMLRMVFTPSMSPDTEPSVHFLSVPNIKEVYTGWWMKLSPNWECSPAGCGKVTFLFTNGAGQVYTGVFHSEGSSNPPYRMAVNTEWAPYGQRIWYPNVTTTPMNPNQWHRIEVYYRWETNPGVSNDGVIRFWVDGVLNGDYSNVHYPASSFVEFQFAPTLQNPPSAEQYMYVDHTKISRR
jgi:spore germination cell wall hydrolase CwlJ-like protein